jgi:hypothetical protein
MVMKKGSTLWKTANIGDSLNEGDKVKLPAKSFLGIVHACGQGKEITKEGIYDVKLLAQTIKPQFTDNYYKTLLSKEMLKTPKSQRYKEIRRSPSMEYADIASPNAYKDTVIGNLLFLKFTSKSIYKISITDIWDEILNEYTFTGDTITIKLDPSNIDPLAMENFKLSPCYKIKIINNVYGNVNAAEFSVCTINSKLERISKQRNIFLSVTSPKTAFSQLLLAAYHEQLGFYFEALKHYHLAMQLAPEVDDYKAYFAEFLTRKSCYRYE